MIKTITPSNQCEITLEESSSNVSKELKKRGINPKHNISVNGNKIFSETKEGINIRYFYLEGGLITYKKGRYNVPYVRTRYNIPKGVFKSEAFSYVPILDKNGIQKTKKYNAPAGTKAQAFIGGLFAFYHNEIINRAKKKVLFITEGEFKSFVLCQSGLFALGISGINSGTNNHKNKDGIIINSFFLSGILDVIEAHSVEHVIMIYDNDIMENTGKKTRALQFNASIKHLYKAAKNRNVNFSIAYHRDVNYKGIDDYITGKKYKISEKSFMLDSKRFYYLPINHITINKIGAELAESVRAYNYRREQYTFKRFLSEKSKIIKEKIKEGKDFALIAPTGAGKNTLLYTLAGESARPFFFGYPTNIANEAQTLEHQDKTEIIKIDQTTDVEIKKYLGDLHGPEKTLNFCYPSVDFVHPLFKKESVLVNDEMHKFISNFSIFKDDHLQAIINNKAQKIFMTGTPYESFLQAYDIDVLEFKRELNPIVHIEMYGLNKSGKNSFNFKQEGLLYKEAATNLIDTIEKSKSKKNKKLHIIYINNISTIEYLAEYAESKGFDTERIYSELKDEEGGIFDIITGQKIVKGFSKCEIPVLDKDKILFSTSVTYESINITNKNIGTFSIFGEKHTHNIIQCVARLRKISKLTVFLFIKDDKNKAATFKLFADYIEDFKADANTLKTQLNKMTKEEIFYEINVNGIKSFRDKYLCDVSLPINKDGTLNRLGASQQFEHKRAIEENLEQKRIRLNHTHRTILKRVDVKEVRLILDGYNLDKALRVEEIISISEEEKGTIKAANKSGIIDAMTKNLKDLIIYVLQESSIYLTPRLKKIAIAYVGRNPIKSIDYDNNIEYINSMGQTGKQMLKRAVLLLLKVGAFYKINTDLVNLIFSKKKLQFERHLNVASHMEKKVKHNKDEVNLIVIKKIYKGMDYAFKTKRDFRNVELLELKPLIYKKYKIKHTDDDFIKKVKSMFLYENKKKNGQYVATYFEKVTIKNIGKFYGLEINYNYP